jgi:plasmid stabilization system protein ParE
LPRLIVTAGALAGLDRCRRFLSGRDPRAARRAADDIRRHLGALERFPQMGRPVDDGMRELVIPFGDSGYVALYHHDAAADAVIILAFRHQREAGY